MRKQSAELAHTRYDAAGNCLTCGEAGRCPGVIVARQRKVQPDLTDAQGEELEWLALELASNVMRHPHYSSGWVWINQREGQKSNPVPCSNKPHPQSYGADLPLSPLSFAQLTKTTKEERAWLAAHPVVIRPAREAWNDTERAYAKVAETRTRKRAAELSLSFSF